VRKGKTCSGAKDDMDYYYPSARFYKTGVDDFGFLNDLYSEFDGG